MVKLLQETIEENLHDIEIDNDLLAMTSKHSVMVNFVPLNLLI